MRYLEVGDGIEYSIQGNMSKRRRGDQTPRSLVIYRSPNHTRVGRVSVKRESHCSVLYHQSASAKEEQRRMGPQLLSAYK